MSDPEPMPARADIEGDDRADLDEIERDLRDVETTLARLADGTYWTDDTHDGRASVPGTDARPLATDS